MGSSRCIFISLILLHIYFCACTVNVRFEYGFLSQLHKYPCNSTKPGCRACRRIYVVVTAR
ncbi:hypothetical protein BDR03DRAFT_943656 [Suillus americanus]|nr:hypothetical protein BDR03DRAFT_943656 [Suillus americanus]